MVCLSFSNSEIFDSLKITLIVAVVAAVVATVIGTLAAVGIFGMNRKLKQTLLAVNNIPMVNPEIVTGVALMLMYVFIFRATGLLKPGFTTLLLSHITFCIPYVVLQVMPKLRQMNRHMYEAALDLGCRPSSAFFKVVLPEILPGVVTGMLMAFTMSLGRFCHQLFHIRFLGTKSVGDHLFHDQAPHHTGDQRPFNAVVWDGASAFDPGKCVANPR